VPNGFNEWLICAAIAAARDEGFTRVSLNFSPFAALLGGETELSGVQRVQAASLRRLKGRFPARQPAEVQPQVSCPSGSRASSCMSRPARPAARGRRRARGESYLPFQ